ncbi:deoxyribodipyrimidine photo-lyase type I [Breoghania corrubedonensis]|uniref:Deoxyribodipyrimidine photo-lyase n=1 Tax=Breoghania corrubedonensis TaxID=665038 RepID=A0A2T5VBH9_9HYPH|nr:deoxyribodipyrimidine photo-lyase [Breoghania corrubedonensis]PTW61106.1 deoxyribodipyrimidine photo-lyase type I [Breoghania corrubedonensis]
MSPSRPHIVWFRDDLRLSDNPALTRAASSEAPIVALYLLDEETRRPLGGAARWWLAGSLRALEKDLRKRGIPLVLRRGPAMEHLVDLATSLKAQAVFWNRRAGADSEADEDKSLVGALKNRGIDSAHFQANVLFSTNDLRTNSGAAYRVFTPFWRAACRLSPERPLPIPKAMSGWEGEISGDILDAWCLRPTAPDWAGGIAEAWTPGEEDAQRRLQVFLGHPVLDYAEGRDFPAEAVTSRLSPSLRFGEISPRQIWHSVKAAQSSGDIPDRAGEKFLAELGWREFCHQLLAAHPALAVRNFNSDFDHFPWAENEVALARWQEGRTGYPVVDAGMRELWATGWMHNRVRMITASFLTKHLLIDWRAGEKWFWDTLVDADPANNPAGWQWVAGCGADAAPYFRIFNPVLQGEKFDPDGAYTRHWVPELALLDKRWLHHPWDAPEAALKSAKITLGQTYPSPLVDHSKARKRALASYEEMKRARS